MGEGRLRGRVLILAGSDSSGIAGAQADLKTVTALGGYGAAAITALTVQDSVAVHEIVPVEARLIEAQARAFLDDIGADAIKTGLLADEAAVEAAARVADAARYAPLVVDPVMIASTGLRLAEVKATDRLRQILIPVAALLTPNAPEAAALTGRRVETTDDLRRAGDQLMALGAGAVLMKGGHVPGARVRDILMTAAGETVFEGERLTGRPVRGTGCALASACATGLAQGLGLETAVGRAWSYVAEAIARAPGLGAGRGPLDHAWPLEAPECGHER